MSTLLISVVRGRRKALAFWTSSLIAVIPVFMRRIVLPQAPQNLKRAEPYTFVIRAHPTLPI
jgi:hypothetical protein